LEDTSVAESDSNQCNDTGKEVGPDKKADVLQSTFHHYYSMAMDHYTKAGNVSQLLLAVVSAMFIMIGYNDKIDGGATDIIGGFMVMSLGLFGAIWAGRQMERYRFWEFIALKYQNDLKGIFPDLKMREEHEPKDDKHLKEPTPQKCCVKLVNCLWHFFGWVQDRYLWIILHVIIMVMGALVFAVALYRAVFPD